MVWKNNIMERMRLHEDAWKKGNDRRRTKQHFLETERKPGMTELKIGMHQKGNDGLFMKIKNI